MEERTSTTPEGGPEDGLAGQIAPFLETLESVRYVKGALQIKRRGLGRFVTWMEAGSRTARSLDESCVSAYLDSVPSPGRRADRSTVAQFLEYLRSRGLVAPRQACSPSPADIVIRRYQEDLRRSYGLAEHSIAGYSPFVREFIAEQSLEGESSLWKSLDAAGVRQHLLNRSRGRSSQWTRLLASALRSFLRFLFREGEISVDLSHSIPQVRRWKLAAVPPFLSSDEVETVLKAVDLTTSQGRRNHAILLLLARLGLRAGEVTTLELDDIHWRQGEIVVRGKGGSCDRLPLPEDVGRALALYLQHDRGPSTSRQVFLRLCAPHVALTGPCAVSGVAREAIQEAGLYLHAPAAAHLFRHSLASRMIRHGASLGEISQVLRHRSTVTTQIYAKVDFETLRGVARSWPVSGEVGDDCTP